MRACAGGRRAAPVRRAPPPGELRPRRAAWSSTPRRAAPPSSPPLRSVSGESSPDGVTVALAVVSRGRLSVRASCSKVQSLCLCRETFCGGGRGGGEVSHEWRRPLVTSSSAGPSSVLAGSAEVTAAGREPLQVTRRCQSRAGVARWPALLLSRQPARRGRSGSVVSRVGVSPLTVRDTPPLHRKAGREGRRRVVR